MMGFQLGERPSGRAWRILAFCEWKSHGKNPWENDGRPWETIENDMENHGTFT